MKKLMFLFAFFALLGVQINAQTTITGTVTSAEDGAPVPGATVRAKGFTDVGTITTIDGKYSLQVPNGATALVFSFVGMKTMELPVNGTVVDAVLQSEDVTVGDVVVTAIGIKRDEKSLGYSATKVSSDDLSKSKSSSVMNSLQGKVAGVVISNTSSGPGGSTKVVLRGYSSIGGNNQPLYVVDGVPINNSTTGVTGIDFGNRANDINPDDVESMTILKGASATALYGSRASSGVIMITTKSGKGSKNKIKVEVSSTTVISDILRVPQMQNTFGQGWSGLFAYEENGSWGPKFDGKDRLWGTIVSNSRKLKPFVGLENNVKDFYENGLSFNNSVSLTGGNDKTSFYVSYSNLKEDGSLPTASDNNKRNTIALRGSTEGTKFNVSAAFNYIRRNTSSVADGRGGQTGASPTMYEELLQIPRDISIVDLKDYNDPFNNLDNYFTVYAANPYWVLDNSRNLFREDRMFGNIGLDYKITDWMTATWRIGGDIANNASAFNEERSDFTAGGHSATFGKAPNPGWVVERSSYSQEFNSDLLLRISPKLTDDISFNGIVGYNINQRKGKTMQTAVTDLELPNFFNLSNTKGNPTSATAAYERRLYGAFGQADFSYKNFAYLSFTARNDWSSTLPAEANSFFYPGVNVSFVFSDAIPAIADYIPYGKIRASWGKTGNDAPMYSVYPSIVSALAGTVQFPVGGVNAYEIGNQLGNNALKPELSTELEFGCDMRFLNNRVGFDFAFYKKTTTDQILAVPISVTSGYSTQVMNFGKVENKGIEFMFNIVPIKTTDFKWDFTWTFSNNRNKVIELTEGLDEVILASAYDVSFVAIPGYSLGVFKGPAVSTDSKGRTIVNASGYPIPATDKEIWGTAESKYVMGFNNSFSYKNFNLGIIFDIRNGGLIYSGSSDLNIFVGNSTQTTFNERQPIIVPNSVRLAADGVTYIENDIPIDMNSTNAYYYHTQNKISNRLRVYDRSYMKLREVTLSYSLPKSIFGNLPIGGIDISLVGRNLLMWTPAENNVIDPETSSFGNDLSGDFGEFRTPPSARTFAVNLKLKF